MDLPLGRAVNYPSFTPVSHFLSPVAGCSLPASALLFSHPFSPSFRCRRSDWRWPPRFLPSPGTPRSKRGRSSRTGTRSLIPNQRLAAQIQTLKRLWTTLNATIVVQWNCYLHLTDPPSQTGPLRPVFDRWSTRELWNQEDFGPRASPGELNQRPFLLSRLNALWNGAMCSTHGL